MDRREALTAFLGLPVTATLSRAQPGPRDVLVIEIPGIISHETSCRIEGHIKSVFGEHQRVLILEDGAKLKMVSHEQAQSEA